MEEVRTIVVNGTRYAWRITHRHESIIADQSTCVFHFLAFREGTSNAALRIRFTGVYTGIGAAHGWINVRELGLAINLHRPRTAAALIRRALALGWSPDAPMIVEDGFAFISNLPTPVVTGLAEPWSRAFANPGATVKSGEF